MTKKRAYDLGQIMVEDTDLQRLHESLYGTAIPLSDMPDAIEKLRVYGGIAKCLRCGEGWVDIEDHPFQVCYSCWTDWEKAGMSRACSRAEVELVFPRIHG